MFSFQRITSSIDEETSVSRQISTDNYLCEPETRLVLHTTQNIVGHEVEYFLVVDLPLLATCILYLYR